MLLSAACFIAGAICWAATESAFDAAAGFGLGEVFVRSDGDVLLVNGRSGTTPEPAPYTGEAPGVVDMPSAPFTAKSHAATDQARSALWRGDPGAAKKALIDVVAAGGADPEDVEILKAACTTLHDTTCLALVRGG
jgi:hypothetical protein